MKLRDTKGIPFVVREAKGEGKTGNQILRNR